MAGLFDSNRYNRPGKGVSEDDVYAKPGFKTFFKILGRKVPSFIGLNLLFLLFSLPFLVFGYVITSGNIVGQYVQEKLMLTDASVDLFFIKIALSFGSALIPVLTSGPAYTGVYYVLRQFSREKHAFVWWDFRDTMKDFIKKGTIIGLINLIVFFLLTYAFYFFVNLTIPALGADVTSVYAWITYIAIGLIGLMILVFMCMSTYVYPILCTYDMPVSKTYRLAYTFALLKLPRNLLVLLLDLVIIYLVYLRMPFAFYWISVILTLLIIPVLIAYINTYNVDACMRKLDPNVDAQANNRAEGS